MLISIFYIWHSDKPIIFFHRFLRYLQFMLKSQNNICEIYTFW